MYISFLQGMFSEIPHSAVAQRRDIIDLFMTPESDSGSLMLLTVRRLGKPNDNENPGKILEIFYFTGGMLSQTTLSITLAAYDRLVNMLAGAGHDGLLTEEHAIKAASLELKTHEKLLTLNKYGLSYDPVFVRVGHEMQNQQNSETRDLSEFNTREAIQYFEDFNAEFFRKVTTRWHDSYNCRAAIDDENSQTLLMMFTAGSIENYRGKTGAKIDIMGTTDDLQIRHRSHWPSIKLEFVVTKPSVYLPPTLQTQFQSAVVQDVLKTDMKCRHQFSILPSVAGFKHQTETNAIFHVDTRLDESLSDHLLSATPSGITLSLQHITDKIFDDEMVNHDNVAFYAEGRLLNFGTKSENSRINLRWKGTIANYMFTEESYQYRNEHVQEVIIDNANEKNDATRLYLLRETDSHDYTNTNIILGFSDKHIDTHFLNVFLQNNRKALGLEESKFCHFVSFHSRRTETFYLTETPINRDQTFPYTADLTPLFNPNKFVKFFT